MNHPISGFAYFIDGFRLISKPGLKRFVIIPLIVNTLLFIGLFFLLKHYMHVFNIWVIAHLPHWLRWLHTVLWILFLISFFVVLVYSFVTIGNIIAAPFNGLLAEKVEYYLTGSKPPERSFADNVKDFPRLMGRQIATLAYYLPRALIILILFFIPLVHVLAPFLWFLLNAWYLTLSFIDYPTDNHRIPFQNVRAWMKKRRLTSLTFGFTVLVTSLIPILNFFTIPAAVAGATKLYVDEKESFANRTESILANESIQQ